MLYLKAYAPDTYQKAQTILQERTAYEKALESCQTKDEVEQLKSRYASAAVERIRAIRKDPRPFQQEQTGTPENGAHESGCP